MSVTTRVARAEDDAALQALDAVAWSDASGFPSTRGRTGPFFGADKPVEVVLVAEQDGEVAGYLVLKPWTTLPEHQHVLAVQGVATHPDRRGVGVGTALLRAAEDRGRALGARKLALGVFATNPRAQALYARLGWVVEGVRRGEWLVAGEPVDDVVMARYLV